MENQKKLLQFIEWIGANVPELQGQDSEQIISTINKLSETPEGQKILQKLIEGFESNAAGMFKKGGKLNYLLCLKNGGIADCGCGKKLKAEDGNILPIPATPERGRKIEFEPRDIGLRIKPLGNYRESNTNIRTGLEDPGRMWTRLQSRSAGPVTQIKYEDESYTNPARTYDTRMSPSPNESANQYIERWRDFDNILKQEGVARTPNLGLAKYQEGGLALPSMKYSESEVLRPFNVAGQDTSLKIGRIRDDGNGARVFESDFKSIPSRILSRPGDLGYNESLKDRIDRRENFEKRLSNEGILKAPDTGIKYTSEGTVKPSGITIYDVGGKTNTEGTQTATTQTATTKIKPEIKPRGLRGIIWEPKKYSRVDFYDNLDGDFTGTRSWYIDPKGTEHQILEKKFPAGNTATTELKITRDKDSTMTITNSQGINKVKDMSKFLPAFKKNF